VETADRLRAKMYFLQRPPRASLSPASPHADIVSAPGASRSDALGSGLVKGSAQGQVEGPVKGLVERGSGPLLVVGLEQEAEQATGLSGATVDTVQGSAVQGPEAVQETIRVASSDARASRRIAVPRDGVVQLQIRERVRHPSQ
jgi:hypothetical protein